MDYTTILKIILSFITGGVFTAITLHAAEKYGTRTGGIIAGLPSTTAVGLFFIGLVQSPQHASTAATVMPASVAGSLIFVLTYIKVCNKKGYKTAALTASIAWFTVAIPFAYHKIDDINKTTALFAIVWIISQKYLKKTRQTETTKKITYTTTQKITRAAFAGTVTASAVTASNLLGPLWGGVITSFPAIFLTTFIILGKQHGSIYSTEFAKNTPLGLLAVIPYIWSVHIFYPTQGLIQGTITSYIISLTTTAAIYKTTNKKTT